LTFPPASTFRATGVWARSLLAFSGVMVTEFITIIQDFKHMGPVQDPALEFNNQLPSLTILK
jgi:hypothetical protein